MKHEELLKHIQQAVDTCFEYELVPYKDGNQWCILYGENIQDGIVGFGDTRLDAMLEFKKEYDSYVKRTHLYPAKEQPLDGLEEAAERAGLEYAPIQKGEALDIEGNLYETDDVNWPSRCGFLTGFKAGAKWDRAKMMEKAVDGRYMKADGKAYVESWPLDIDPNSVKAGDEVRLIVLPKED